VHRRPRPPRRHLPALDQQLDKRLRVARAAAAARVGEVAGGEQGCMAG
jgi:hypothetical protein